MPGSALGICTRRSQSAAGNRQVNPELPWTNGNTAIEPGAIDVLVPAAEPPIELPVRLAGLIDRAITDRVA